MKRIIVLVFAALTQNLAQALQFTLSTMEPVCISVSPTSVNDGMTVTYTITGMNEDMVTFTAR